MRSIAAFPAFFIFGTVNSALAHDTPQRTLFADVRFLDGAAEQRIENAHVLIEGNLIKSISAEPMGAEAATVTDVGGRTMIPGLIDLH